MYSNGGIYGLEDWFVDWNLCYGIISCFMWVCFSYLWCGCDLLLSELCVLDLDVEEALSNGYFISIEGFIKGFEFLIVFLNGLVSSNLFIS